MNGVPGVRALRKLYQRRSLSAARGPHYDYAAALRQLPVDLLKREQASGVRTFPVKPQRREIDERMFFRLRGPGPGDSLGRTPCSFNEV